MFTLSLERCNWLRGHTHSLRATIKRRILYLHTRGSLVVTLLRILIIVILTYFVKPRTSVTLSRVITKYWLTRIIYRSADASSAGVRSLERDLSANRDGAET